MESNRKVGFNIELILISIFLILLIIIPDVLAVAGDVTDTNVTGSKTKKLHIIIPLNGRLIVYLYWQSITNNGVGGGRTFIQYGRNKTIGDDTNTGANITTSCGLNPFKIVNLSAFRGQNVTVGNSSNGCTTGSTSAHACLRDSFKRSGGNNSWINFSVEDSTPVNTQERFAFGIKSCNVSGTFDIAAGAIPVTEVSLPTITFNNYFNISVASAPLYTHPNPANGSTYGYFTNNTNPIKNEFLNISVRMIAIANVSHYRFATNNSGSWVNSTWVKPGGTSTHNVTNWTRLNASNSVRVGFYYYSNDTFNQINRSILNTFKAIRFGTLNVSISAPINNTIFPQKKTFNVTSKVTCQLQNCNAIYATIRFNITGSLPNSPINSTANGLTPLSVATSRYTMSVWNRTYNPGITDTANAVTIDFSNNIYAVGQTAASNWFIAKLNSTGKSIWNRTYNPGSTDEAFGITIDSSSNIYVVGQKDNVNWFIMKINSTGGSIWNRTYNPAGVDQANGITIDSSSNIYVVGQKGDATNNWFIMKINSTGGSIWNRTYNPGASDTANGITIDTNNNIYAVGSISSGNNWFIMKINSTGGSIWNRTYITSGGTAAKDVTIDFSNNIYAVGQTAASNWFIMKINSTGGSIWNRTYNLGGIDEANAVTKDSSNNIYVTGYKDSADWFIMKINANGNSIWNRTYNPAGVDQANGITIDSSNNIYVVGQTAGLDLFIMKHDNSLSYQTCGILNTGQFCTFDWQINGTSLGGYKIGVFYNSTGLAAVNVTDNLTIRIGAVQVADSCTPPGSGNWIITDVCYKNNQNIILTGAGSKIIINAGGLLICDRTNITNAGKRANRTILGATAVKLVRKGASMC